MSVPRGFKKRPDEIYLVLPCPSPVDDFLVQVVSRKASKWLAKEFKSQHHTRLMPIETEMTLYTLEQIKSRVHPEEYASILKEVEKREHV